jgi:long-chain-fatty-acid---luciferin-component ligase
MSIVDERTEARRVRPADLGPLDVFLYEDETGYVVDGAAQRRAWLLEAVEHHLAGSPIFQRLAAAKGFDAGLLRTTGDPAIVPLVSSGTFKRRRIETQDDIERWCTSSGTRGTKSLVPRDRRTLERFAGTVGHGLREFLGAHREQREGFVLGPPAEEAGDLWFSYSLGLAEVVNHTDYFVRDGLLQEEELLAALDQRSPGSETVVIAPPSLLLNFLLWLDKRGCSLELAHGFVLTAGGWKRSERDAIARSDIEQLVTTILAIPPERQRDIFNMVELNTVIFECEVHTKHVPPWLTVLARDPETLAPLPSGETGVIAFLDPTALSYPAFVLTDDLGAVATDGCPCGRVGDALVLDRRLSSVEERGCGLKMQRYGAEA